MDIPRLPKNPKIPIRFVPMQIKVHPNKGSNGGTFNTDEMAEKAKSFLWQASLPPQGRTSGSTFADVTDVEPSAHTTM